MKFSCTLRQLFFLHLYFRMLIARGANLLAVNADGNMPYDICEDEDALDYIEGEMAKRGVTQQLIDETRAYTEINMLSDLQKATLRNGDLEAHDSQGATPVGIHLFYNVIVLVNGLFFSCWTQVFYDPKNSLYAIKLLICTLFNSYRIELLRYFWSSKY